MRTGSRGRRVARAVWWLVICGLCLTLAGFPPGHHASSGCRPGQTPLQCWLDHPPFYIAHRGGDADWVEGTADAYRKAAAWNASLALEVPVWRTADGVWVVSEDPTTGRVFGTDDDIRRSTWAQLSTLRSVRGGYPMARLVQDILVPYGRSRILFIDNKGDADVGPFLDLLDSYGGPSRYVCKSYYHSLNTATAARRRGYLTWGYYYQSTMGDFAATEHSFDLLGLNYDAPASSFATLRATGKPVIAHVVRTRAGAEEALAKGAEGIMASGVREIVPRTP